jgi:hypothetical protein
VPDAGLPLAGEYPSLRHHRACPEDPDSLEVERGIFVIFQEVMKKSLGPRDKREDDEEWVPPHPKRLFMAF